MVAPIYVQLLNSSLVMTGQFTHQTVTGQASLLSPRGADAAARSQWNVSHPPIFSFKPCSSFKPPFSPSFLSSSKSCSSKNPSCFSPFSIVFSFSISFPPFFEFSFFSTTHSAFCNLPLFRPILLFPFFRRSLSFAFCTQRRYLQ